MKTYLKDYKNIKIIIDEIIGIDTQQGSNLKMAIKKYFELKPIDVKLVSNVDDFSSSNSNYYTNARIPIAYDKEMDDAMSKYTKELKKNLDKIKAKGDYCGISG
tara:strand:- start:18597 stop:18908 length:312 start_codon:yes stop_codon:yes gene_type:complete